MDAGRSPISLLEEFVRFDPAAPPSPEPHPGEPPFAVTAEDLKLLTENTKAGLAVVSAGGTLLFANQSAAALLGYSPDEMRRLVPEEVVQPEDLTRAREHRRAAASGHPAPDGFDMNVRDRCGAWVPVHLDFSPISWHGEPAVAVAVRGIMNARRDPAAAPAPEGPNGGSAGGAVEADGPANETPGASPDGAGTVQPASGEDARRHAALIEAISRASVHLEEAHRWSDCLPDITRALGRAAGVSGCFAIRAVGTADTVRLERLQAWTAAGGMSPGVDPPVIVDLPASSLPSPLAHLQGGRIAVAGEDALPGEIRELFGSEHARAFLLVPFHANRRWRGFIGFTRDLPAVSWDLPELDTLRVAANLLALSIGRQEMEHELRAVGHRYLALIEGARSPMIVFDAHGTVTRANTVAATETGIPRNEFPGRSIEEIFPEPHCSHVREGLRVALESGGPWMVQAELSFGAVSRWKELRIQPIGEFGRLSGTALLLIIDLTSQKRAQERVLHSERRLRAAAVERSFIEFRERKRIAKQLHDRVSQSLAVAKMQLDALGGTAGPLSAHVRETVSHVVRQLDGIIEDTLALTHDLDPPVLTELGLGPALGWLADQVRRKEHVTVHFRESGRQLPLGPDLEQLVFRTVEDLLIDLLANVQPSEIFMSIRTERGEVICEIKSSGGRQTVAAWKSKGPSVFVLRERLRLVGGRLQFRLSPEGGRAILRVPLHDPGEAREVPS